MLPETYVYCIHRERERELGTIQEDILLIHTVDIPQDMFDVMYKTVFSLYHVDLDADNWSDWISLKMIELYGFTKLIIHHTTELK